ncbi:TPA: hypothetical protein NVL90_001385 [Klebsiella oxytoca]|nr:hypothetical protein [Klebsiella oxytoca]HCJ7378759.1 hypothetical protein [Klebsiella oxytoca]HDX4249465.1 hypothetical protein [Klebsiella oxytoca]
MKKKFLAALTVFLSFSAMAEQRNIQNECSFRATMLSDIVGLYKKGQCSKNQAKQFVHEVATGGTQTLNSCIPKSRYKNPDYIDGKKFEMWTNSVIEKTWSNSMKGPDNYGAFMDACMNNPDIYIGGQWLYK